MSHSWENIQVTTECTLIDALKIIDAEALRTVLVVGEDKRLLGVVTDGDVRRGIIRGVELKSTVLDVMNTHPKTVSINTSREEVVNLMGQLELLTIPILDDGKLVGLHTIYEALGRPKYDNPVFLMAGGFGTRLRPLTNDCPKPLLTVGDKPILETLLLRFIKAGFHKFYISTHYLPQMIMDYFGDGSKWEVDITYVHEETPLGTGGALGLLPSDIPQLPIVVMNGDILTKMDFEHLLWFHNENESSATMCVREHDYQVPYGVVQSENGKVYGMTEKPKYSYYINAGIYLLNPKVLSYVKHNEHIDMPSLLQKLVDKQSEVSVYPLHEYWLDIGSPTDFQQAQIDFKSLSL